MKIFMSWSKPASNKVAHRLKQFILDILDKTNLKFFISSEDIPSGDKWFNAISTELRTSQLAIMIATKENRHSRWLDFECGAIAFNGKGDSVCAFLFDIDELESGHPLKQYQHTKNSKQDILKLVKSIYQKTRSNLSERQIETLFNAHYPELEKDLSTIKSEITPVDNSNFDNNTYPSWVHGVHPKKLFVGTPMASIQGDQYLENRREILEVIEVIKTNCDISSVYSPVEKNDNPKEFQDPELAMMIDFTELKRCEYFVFIYPEKTASSILVEIGYAIALMKKIIIYVKKTGDLPYMLEKANVKNKNLKIYTYTDFQDLKKKIKNSADVIFNFNA